MAEATLRTHTITVNGDAVAADGLPVQTTLLDFLRDRGLTGAKEGCAEGECGACTVVMVSEDGERSEYQAVNSCLIFVPCAAGREFFTVEALAQNGELAEAQKAMAAAGGSQCGYCTPGFVMSLFAEQYRPGREGPCDPHAMGGNLCRCTGYRPIRDAALSLGPAPAGYFSDRLAKPAPPPGTVEYTHGDVRLERPVNLAECLAIAARYPKATWISGATDMAVESNLKASRWTHLVSLEGVAALREFCSDAARVRIGSALPLTAIERQWTDAPEAVGAWMKLFASPTIRNRATVGGSLATASPIGDAAPLFMALNASVQVLSTEGARTIPLSGFFAGYRQTNLQRAELIRAIEVPKPYPAFTRFYKASKRRMDDISTVAAGLSLDFAGDGTISGARFAFGGVAAVPLRVLAAEEAAVGQPWNEATVAHIRHAIHNAIQPMDDHRGSARYRLELAKSFIEKFFEEWRERQ